MSGVWAMGLWIGLALTAAGWLATRAAARAWSFRRPLGTLLDAAAPMMAFGVALAATARPVFAGVVSFAMFGGFAFADLVKRLILRETVLFTDMSEFRELIRHPHLYLPFAGTGRVLAGFAAAVAGFVALLVFEPPAWPWSPIPGLIALALVALFIWSLYLPLLQSGARALRRMGPSGDPIPDSAVLGTLAMQLVYGMIARSERAARRAANPPPAAPAVVRSRGSGPPVMLVQSESFFDPRRLHPAIAADLLPAFDRARDSGVQWGRLAVPAYAGNTMRTEFEALTGMSEAEIGYDRFNPYHALARRPVGSIAWRLREQGYRTICVHPYDRTFYRRDIAMPNLGFDVFLGEESFPDAEREGLYITDLEVARRMEALLQEEGAGTFLFAITMQNHGPYTLRDDRDLAPGLPAVPEADALQGYLRGVRQSDAMLGQLCAALEPRGGVLGFYGDHLPGMSAPFAALGFEEMSSDYLIWRAGGGPAVRKDLAAHQLAAAMLGALAP